MRVEHVAPWLLLAISFGVGCAEQAVCAEGRVRGRDTVVVQCSTGKVPVCGDNPDLLYDTNSGALLPTPALPDITDPAIRASFTGSCDGVSGPCRPRPACPGAAGDAPICANGETALCLLGRVDEIMAARDSGAPPPEDAGGGDDAGPDDAGPGDTDAGDTDAG
ncbi:MAG: hypothetical protein R3B82_19755, partial [Sandaracinaceae bacterium]